MTIRRLAGCSALLPRRTIPPETDQKIIELDEAKDHCRVAHDENDEDPLIKNLILAAESHIDGYEGILGRALITQTWVQELDRFWSEMRLPLAPIQSIASIRYYDINETQQTLADTVYRLHSDAVSPYITLQSDQEWPATFDRDDAVEITFVAGYGNADAVPETIRQAMLLMVGHWYENRELLVPGQLSPMPMAADALLQPYRRTSI